MAEQIFIGDAPTNEAGKEIRFPTSDVWVALHECITSDLYPDLPFFPTIGPRDAMFLATAIRGALADGSCERHFGDQALLEAMGTPKEEKFAADKYLAWMKGFATFLEGAAAAGRGKARHASLVL